MLKRSRLLIATVLWLAVLGGMLAGAEAQRAAMRVIDGDTFVLNGERVRIFGLDCPELQDRGGPEAKRALRNLLRQPVTIRDTGQRSHGRTVAVVYSGKRDVARRLIASGTCREWCFYSNGRYGTCRKG